MRSYLTTVNAQHLYYNVTYIKVRRCSAYFIPRVCLFCLHANRGLRLSLFIRNKNAHLCVSYCILFNILRCIIKIVKLTSLSRSLECNHRKLLILRGSPCQLPIVCCSEIKCKTDLLSCVDVCIPFTSVLMFIVCVVDNIDNIS